MEAVILIILLFATSSIIILTDLVYYAVDGQTKVNSALWLFAEFLHLIILPAQFTISTEDKNDCCSESAFFSPEHALTIWIIISLCILGYYYATYRSILASPLIEVTLNCTLLIAVALNAIMIFHHSEFYFGLVFHSPIIMLFMKSLIRNYRLTINTFEKQQFNPSGKFSNLLWKVLNQQIFVTYPLLIILCFPLLALLGMLLVIFGQQPDSAVLAFTETYKHGFSQLNDQCINAVCPDGHFLCTIAAKGDRKFVKPVRLGRRAGQVIICNRQLLISNAFEDLIQQKAPCIHKPVRSFYNQVGKFVHRYYGAFNRKWISNLIYVLMKPLEYLFLFTLYLFDRNPENRIAKQYIDPNEKSNLLISISHDQSQ